MRSRVAEFLSATFVACSVLCLSTAASLHQQETAEQFVDRVKKAMQNDEWGRARSGIGHALALKPQSAEANFVAAQVYWHEGARSMAIDALDKAIEYQSVYPEAHLLLARCLANDNKPEKAREEVKLAQGISGFSAYRLLGEIDLAKEGVPAAIDSFETALAYATAIDDGEANRIREQLSGLREFTEKFARFSDLEAQQKGSNIVGPVLLNTSFPGYTEEARALKIQGTVAMVLLITEKGDVDTVLVYRHLGHGLDERAMEAARKLKFSPASQSGQPVRFMKRLIMQFTLR